MKRLIALAGLALGLCGTPTLAAAATYYVDAATGDNARTTTQAQNPATPWKTIKKAVDSSFAGDTVRVSPGTYAESVESKRDGTAQAPIVVLSITVGGAIVQPPSGTSGFFVSHNYLTIDGFKVTAGVTGLKLGPHDGGSGPVVGLLVQNNAVYGNANNGIQVTNGITTEIAFNTVYNNGKNGIVHQGNSSLIHDNIVHHNGQFGIYVKDGVDHQLYDNMSYSNTGSNFQILGTTLPTPNQTYYVDCVSGNDANTPTQAKNAASPWKTVKTALATVDGGDTIVLLGGTEAQPVVCNETTIESKRDGTADNRITIRAQPQWGVIIDPPSGNGIVITHDYHTLVGLIVTGAANGIQLGPHDGGDGPVSGMVVNTVRVYGNSVAGVKFTNAVSGAIKNSIVYGNGSHGISYSGSGANIFNNLVYRNGGGGNYGITILDGTGHNVRNNTIYGNTSGGLRLSTNSAVPVSATAVNNIIAGSPSNPQGVGVKEQGTGTSSLTYNNVFGNTLDYQLGQTPVGAGSISLNPGFIDPASDDFRLGRLATGQAANSPCIDAGSATSDALNLSGRTAFSDKLADTGLVDLGYHGTILSPTQGTVVVSGASMTFNQGVGNDGFTLALKLSPGQGSDGIEPGTNYTEVSFGSFFYTLPVTGFQSQGGGQWTYTGTGQLASGTFVKQLDGSVDVSVQATGLTLAYTDSPISIGIRIGDDFGSHPGVSLRGTLQFP